MDKNEEIDFLLFKDWQEEIIPNLGKQQYVTIHDFRRDGSDVSGLYAVFMPNSYTEQALKSETWDVLYNKILPCFQYCNNQEIYLPFGNDIGIEPFVIKRSFNGLKSDYYEISQDFRFFHNLFYEKTSNNYLKIDESGNKEIIIRCKDEIFEVRLKELREYQYIKNMDIAFYFDVTRSSNKTLKVLGISKSRVEKNKDNSKYSISLGRLGLTYSLLIGKKILQKPEIKPASLDYYSKNDEDYPEFIIDVDEEGNNVSNTCNPDLLGDFYGKNPDAPNYITFVFFRKDVLSKYYGKPSIYTVTSVRDSKRSIAVTGLRWES